MPMSFVGAFTCLGMP